MADILDIHSDVVFDESIVHYEVHAHQPYTSSYENSDEIRILIQHQDLCLLPSHSSLHIVGRLTKSNGQKVANTAFVRNAICHLFEEILYEINAVEIDRCKNVGLTSLMKGLPSCTINQKSIVINAGFDDTDGIEDKNGYFDTMIPLSMLLGFAEDYRKVLVNVKHELILTRSRTDINAVLQTIIPGANDAAPGTWEDFKIQINRLEWLMPYVTPCDSRKIRLLNHIGKDKYISMSFRSWELFEYPRLPTGSKHVWTVKTSNQLEKPRYVILGFQTNRKGVKNASFSTFDHCNIRNVKVFLNSQYYPYGNLNINFPLGQATLLYDMFINFISSYYGVDTGPMIGGTDYFQKFPLIVIDCSKQNESLKNAPVDVRLEIEAEENFPDNTAAYCLLLHDRIVKYNPMSGDVKKMV